MFSVHIKGHQDNNHDINELPLEVRLNIKMDSIARYQVSNKEMTTDYCNNSIPHPKSFPILKHNGMVIRDNIKNELYEGITAKNILTAWIEKGRLTEETISAIDWEVHLKAFKIIKEGRYNL